MTRTEPLHTPLWQQKKEAQPIKACTNTNHNTRMYHKQENMHTSGIYVAAIGGDWRSVRGGTVEERSGGEGVVERRGGDKGRRGK